MQANRRWLHEPSKSLPAMRRFFLALFWAVVIVVLTLSAVLTAVGWGARRALPPPMLVLGTVAYSVQQFWVERGCFPLVPAALFDKDAAAAPRAQIDCSDEQARVPLARPYLPRYSFDPRTRELLVKTKGGTTARVSLGYEDSPTGRVYFVRIEGLSPAVAQQALQECNTSDAPPSAEFVDKCRSPFLGALDLRLVKPERATVPKAPR